MRLIDAEAFETEIMKFIPFVGGESGFIRVGKVLELIERVPTIEAKPIVHAHWEEVRCSKKSAKWLHRVSCSNCHKEGHKRYDFCPACGAQMDEVVE